MYKLLLPVVGVASMLACDTVTCVDDTGTAVDECADSGDTGDTNNGGDEGITVNWTSGGMTVELENINTTGFDFGMAETRAGEGGWYGEDCLAGTAGYRYCHVFNNTQVGSLSSVYPDPDAVVAGSTTLFDSTFEGALTYVVTIDDSRCFVWGEDPSYYLGSDSFSDCENWGN